MCLFNLIGETVSPFKRVSQLPDAEKRAIIDR